MNRKDKGEYGYLSYKKKSETIKTVLFFLIPLALFAAGIITTGTKKNLLTLVAVLGILPASKNAVLMIMYLKSRGLMQDGYDKIQSVIRGIENTDQAKVLTHLTVLYDMVFTTQEVTYEVPALYVYGGSICGFLQAGKVSKKKDRQTLLADLEKHLETCLKKEGISVNVKMFDTSDAFVKRLQEVKPLEKASEFPYQASARILCQIAL